MPRVLFLLSSAELGAYCLGCRRQLKGGGGMCLCGGQSAIPQKGDLGCLPPVRVAPALGPAPGTGPGCPPRGQADAVRLLPHGSSEACATMSQHGPCAVFGLGPASPLPRIMGQGRSQPNSASPPSALFLGEPPEDQIVSFQKNQKNPPPENQGPTMGECFKNKSICQFLSWMFNPLSFAAD